MHLRVAISIILKSRAARAANESAKPCDVDEELEEQRTDEVVQDEDEPDGVSGEGRNWNSRE